jgi:hypothetical protein
MNTLNKGIEMNHISLKKVTLVVSTCVLASYFVSAEDKLRHVDVPVVMEVTAKIDATKAKVTKGLASPVNDISALLTQLDSDKNGLLSKAEVMASKNELLAKHFNDIDKNADLAISKEELKGYFSALKVKS